MKHAYQTLFFSKQNSNPSRAMKALCALVLVSALLCGSAPAALAQTFRGKILGTITDSAGAAVADATVTAKNILTGIKRSTTTDDAGNYTIAELPIGDYEIRIDARGFPRHTVITNVKVEVAGERRIDAMLEASGGNEEVTINADTLQVQTTNNTLGGTIQAKQVADLPVNGRDFTKFLVLVPGATGDPSGATDSPGSFGLFSSNGNRGRANNFLLDGTDMNDGYRNLPAINEAGVFGTPATILPVEAIAEAAILSNFEAEYGRNSGSIVNIVTKSGTNQVHGSLFEFFRHNALDARNFFNPKPDPQTEFRNNQFGFAAGGPFVQNRTFWFTSYEGQREKVGLNSVARVPSAAEIQEVAALSGPINPVIRDLLARNPWPAPNRPVALFDPTPNLFVTTPAKNNIHSFIAKVDHSFNERSQLTGRYYFGDSDQSFPLAILAGNVLPGFNTVTPTTVNLLSLSFLKIFSPTKVNEARFGYNRFDEGFFPEDSDFDPRTIGLNTGIQGSQDFGLPFIRIRNAPEYDFASLASLGATLSVPRARVDTNWHFIDNLTFKLTQHEIKTGYEFRRTFVNAFFDAGYRGRLDFDSLEGFLAGTPSGGRSAIGDSRRNTYQNSHALYLQDAYRWSKNLTVNLGLRYDYFGVIGEKHGLFSNFDPQNGLHMVDRLYDRDLNNLSPRLGLAWDLTGKGKTVVRSGWGLFYDAFSQDFFVGQLPFNTFRRDDSTRGADFHRLSRFRCLCH
jgi:hypothetical protein